ncbi:hypothetical protein E2C01_033559 [Portunus trituberculatus]|uniref:Uncharacterized protein n=1 Tax=Portunus trituberculatus TaxID=210409 RepID=A0A5B7F2S2_PORTR|nr:hypothetical protein [Portunus trituberculatus]
MYRETLQEQQHLTPVLTRPIVLPGTEHLTLQVCFTKDELVCCRLAQQGLVSPAAEPGWGGRPLLPASPGMDVPCCVARQGQLTHELGNRVLSQPFPLTPWPEPHYPRNPGCPNPVPGPARQRQPRVPPQLLSIRKNLLLHSKYFLDMCML